MAKPKGFRVVPRSTRATSDSLWSLLQLWKIPGVDFIRSTGMSKTVRKLGQETLG